MGLFNFIKKLVGPAGIQHPVELGKTSDAITPPLVLPPERYYQSTKPIYEIPFKPKPAPPLPKPLPLPKPVVDDTEYKAPLRLLAEGCPLLFISGKAGTGKTVFIRYLIDSLPHKKIAVVAYTGIAALNCGGSTIHSFFKIKPLPFYDATAVPKTISDVVRSDVYANLDILVIDEISMVRADLLDLVDAFLRKHGPRTAEPFGGVQVVLVGDLFQLEPIVKTHQEKAIFGIIHDQDNPSRYRTPFFFSAESFKKTVGPKPIILVKVHRQQDAGFIAALDGIRTGDNLFAAVASINNLCSIQPKMGADDGITLTCRNATADENNEQRLAGLPGEAHIFNGVIWGTFQRVKEDDLPVPLNLHLKTGASIIFKKNDPDKRWVNGTMGTVEKLEGNYVTVKTEAGTVVDVQRMVWEKYGLRYNKEEDKYEQDVTGGFTQFPLDLGWAISIHKSQGMTLGKMRIIPDGAFACGQMYVALSRARAAKAITLSRPIQPGDIRVHPIAKLFHQRLQQAAHTSLDQTA
jgi:hypothetical protein